MEDQILKIAIGQQIAQALNLKVDKAGKIKTEYGPKTIEGLGATILNIVEEQKKRLQD